MNPEKFERLPARSRTPAAWMALGVLTLLGACWIFFAPLVCGTLLLALNGVAWSQGIQLTVGHLVLTGNGGIQAQQVSLSFGPQSHRSSWKCDAIEVHPSSLLSVMGFSHNNSGTLLRELSLGRSKLLIDRRSDGAQGSAALGGATAPPKIPLAIPWLRFLPSDLLIGPIDLIVIGETSRVAVTGLYAFLPNRWAGKVLYTEASLDIGSVHRAFPAARATANWDGRVLRLGAFSLDQDLHFEELTLAPRRERIEFGVRGMIGEGLIRGDGAIGLGGVRRHLEATLVGENLTMEALFHLLKEENQRASGTIRQGRFTFRGDPGKPLEADCSLRLVADAFRWEGRGWDSLKLASTLTGRVLTLAELSLHQQENEVEAQGESNLPEDWHEALKAPFTATFHAMLDDAGALAALTGADIGPVSGGLSLEGEIKGAENKAEGYCNLIGTEMKIRKLPIDWLKGCLLFQGNETKLSNLEAWSGKDCIVMEGKAENSAPHHYQGAAQFSVANLTKRLAQLGISTASQIGGGALRGNWKGEGSKLGHSGSFQAKVTDWVSPWTRAGMSGSFEGTYAPGHLNFTQAEFQQEDLSLNLQLAASPKRLEISSILAKRKGKSEPLVAGSIALPVDAPALWQSGELLANLDMRAPLALQLSLHGIKAEELADLLGQPIPCTGILEGDLSATGTPETPEIRSTMQIARLRLTNTPGSMSVSWSLDSSAGRARCHLVQEPAKNTPFSLQADIPFRFAVTHGVLGLAESTAALHADITLHGLSLNEWGSLWSTPSWALQEGVLNGSIKLNGTTAQPILEGSLLLSARGAILPGAKLANLTLPIIYSQSKATASGGTALYGETPIALAGLLDWSHGPWFGHIDLSGHDFHFPSVLGLESRGDAQLSLSIQGTNTPTLSGMLNIKNISSPGTLRVTPSFTPPGIGMRFLPSPNALFPISTTTASSSSEELQLDLHAKTEGLLPILGATGHGEQLQADLRVQGFLSSPRWDGRIEAKHHIIQLPCGEFEIPSLLLQCSPGGEEQITFAAYGLTPLGFWVLHEQGKWSDAPLALDLLPQNPNVTAADCMLALIKPEATEASSSQFDQDLAWLRQNTLFPLPPLDWITGRAEDAASDANPDGLGFYGRPWNYSLQMLPNLPEPSLSPKNHP